MCGPASKVAEACNKIANCVAFTYEFQADGTPCGYLKYATKQGQFKEGWMAYFKDVTMAATPKMVTTGRKLAGAA